MILETTAGVRVEVDDRTILAAAGVIFQARRKVHAGAPRKLRGCRWCRGEIAGRDALEQHERGCSQRPPGGYAPCPPADVAAMAWPPVREP
jgi:hypothetical protein